MDELTGRTEEAFPGLRDGCLRRRCHARLSTLRYFTRCDSTMLPTKRSLTEQALALAPQVLKDPKAPGRDKLALRALRVGNWCFDLMWRIQEGRKV